MEKLFASDGVALAGHLALPRRAPGKPVPGLVIAHGYPSSGEGGRLSAHSFPELAERIAGELGWAVVVFTFRGAGDSDGNFSLRGWLRDLLAAVQFARGVEGVVGSWVAGFGTGGALAICAAAIDTGIPGVAALSAPADFDDWASHPRRLLQHSRDMGIVPDTGFPPSFDQWSRELRDIRAVAAVQHLHPRPLLVVHGSDDEAVPVFDARVLADAHGEADLRIIEGGAHQLRHDPRAVAILLGWLDRQRNQVAVTRMAHPASGR